MQNEGLWFFTLKRFGKATQILNIPEYKLLLPIPQREVQLNTNMTQNPGW
ncbi:MAG: RagB/SusD family nutrient uptake outer membrane protein [Candidatus Symbiothrix sp.]|nr:RagB/SusD family nutrient uptake outer membrane protein [Candidatus Symbiothrix sp.]